MRLSRLSVLLSFFIIVYFTQCRRHGLPPGDPDNGGLFLPKGFEAVVVVDSLDGAARHIAVNSNGDIYVKLRFPLSSGGNAALRDEDNDGKAEIVKDFDEYQDKSSYGTGMRIHNGYLYFSSVTRVFRQKLTPGQLVPDTKIELMLTDTQPPSQHDTKPIAFDDKGNMYVPFGAPSDCCQMEDRTPFSPGMDSCPMLLTRGGIWKFDANKPGQFQKDGQKFATGVRSIVALEWNDQDHNLFTMMHGRDYLHAQWPNYYTEWDGALLPAEEFLKLKEGSNVGWPYYYYDQLKGKLLLNPEYGGDGKKEGNGSDYTQPLIGFPGHFAPNDLLFYTGNQFPAHYKNGAFIAFHGSTSSAPYPQSGYFVAFVPFKNGSPSGQWEVFADGFAGVDTVVNTSDAKYRPMGLSMGPDGSLYVCDSEKGKIWRIMYKGDTSKFGQADLSDMIRRKKEALNIKTPDSIRDNLDKGNVSIAGKTFNTYCAICHQRDGLGNDRFPPLSGSEWVKGDKNSLIAIVLSGLDGNITVKGKSYNNKMPRLNLLSDENIAQILTYIRQNFNNNASAVTLEDVNNTRKALGGKVNKPGKQ
ncbi:c-type cytochrome [Ginsengibacter hankyongi]|uniref:C-type cytochrome n=1 Tax=Ginsengibacter hankyongi TaxID=2607284 RepID=A0A5J5IEK2_9BACT|nr:c-type cytochrome [Ginsengibacter hankyongi]KAA9037713.1 c-type cytochrome [Ginsengibacter hankyongi]